jgi:hypothetical protein
MALDAKKITRSLAELRKFRSTVFGSDCHGLLLNEKASEDEIIAFERLHKVRLPSDYRDFLTMIGDGGAGPFYGVFPLGMMDQGFDLGPWLEGDGIVGVIAEPFPLEEEWNDLRGNPADEPIATSDPEYGAKVEQFEARYWNSSIVNGAIPICHVGCAIRIWIVVTGNQRGSLWLDGRAELTGISPLRDRSGAPATFESWYEEWLDNALREAGLAN